MAACPPCTCPMKPAHCKHAHDPWGGGHEVAVGGDD